MEKKSGFTDPIGDRMKSYENTTQVYLDQKLPMIVRLDGHHFSKFTKGFNKPFDLRFSQAMVETCCDLMNEFGPALVFTQSDEITMVYAPILAEGESSNEKTLEVGNENNNNNNSENEADQKEDKVTKDNKGCRTMIYNGKVSKIVSLMASFCGVRFNVHLNAKDYASNLADKKNLDKIQSHMAYFDARAFNVPTETEAINNVLWRSHVDCRRNSILNLGAANFSAKQLHGLKTGQIREKLLNDKGIDWATYPEAFKFGTFVKKEKFEKEVTDPKTGNLLKVMRSRVVARTLEMKGFRTYYKYLLFGKYWNEYDDEMVKNQEAGTEEEPLDDF